MSRLKHGIVLNAATALYKTSLKILYKVTDGCSQYESSWSTQSRSQHCGEGDTDAQTFTNRFSEAILSLRHHGHF